MSETKENEKFQISDTQEEYLKIYHEYFVLKWDWSELCRHHNCTKFKISTAIHWVIDNRLNIPSKYLIKGAIDAITTRLKINQELYDKESSKKRYRDNQFIIALIKELREDEKTLYKLEEVHDGDADDETKLSAVQVLKLIREAGNTKKD